MPSRPPIPHSRPDLGPREAAAAADTVAGGAVAQGAQVAAFEAEVAAAVGRRFGVAVSSGTAALHLALQALTEPEGPAPVPILMPSYVCGALVHATRAAGATPRVVDVDGNTGNLEAAPDTEGCGAAIVPHMFGRPAAAAAGLNASVPVIEDLAMALGSDGVGRSGAVAVCSFYATKVITTAGAGGMVLTDDEGLAASVRELRQYDGLGLGRQRWNYMLTDVAAAVGRVQVARLPDLVRRRRQLAARYDEALAGLPARRPPPARASNDYRYVLGLDAEAGLDVDEAIAHLEGLGVMARRPVPQPLHRGLGLPAAAFAGTERLWQRALSLPLYPSLSDAEVGRVVAAAREALETAVSTRVRRGTPWIPASA